MRLPMALCGALLCSGLVQVVAAQDAVKADPKHYTVVSENDQVRVLKVHYGPHEKSVMHSHPNSVAVPLTDSTAEFTLPDGKKQSMTMKAGEAQFTPGSTHLPENAGDKGMDLILVELKK